MLPQLTQVNAVCVGRVILTPERRAVAERMEMAMKLRDLLVVLDGSARGEAVLSVAMGLARRHDAHLTGFCPLEVLMPANLAFALGGYPALTSLQGAANQLEDEALEKAERIAVGFRDQLRGNEVRGDWQVGRGAVAEVVARRARMADLVVLPQADPDHPLPPAARHLVEDVLMSVGRPLLLVPFAGRFDTIGTNVLVGWNGTREAARAVHDALLLIEPTAKVTVLTVERGRFRAEPTEMPGADIAEHLARHGLNVSAARTATDGSIADSDALLSYSSDIGADLLVVGGYGHSRARELVLGGVSRGLLQHMTLPLLMSH
jgi:nucleotide-binding universal stress UspA family protein